MMLSNTQVSQNVFCSLQQITTQQAQRKATMQYILPPFSFHSVPRVIDASFCSVLWFTLGNRCYTRVCVCSSGSQHIRNSLTSTTQVSFPLQHFPPSAPQQQPPFKETTYRAIMSLLINAWRCDVQVWIMATYKQSACYLHWQKSCTHPV